MSRPVSMDSFRDDQGLSDSGSVDLPSALRVGGAGDSSSALDPSSVNTPVQPDCSPLLPQISISDKDKQRLIVLAKLMKVEDEPTVLDCCQVFNCEILQDFPVTAFLQEPIILQVFIDIIESCLKLKEGAELVIQSLGCLCKLSEKLFTQLHKYQDPNMVTSFQEYRDIKGLPRRPWSVLEFCWAGLSISSECIRGSDCSAVLGEALTLLRTCLAIHTTFFPHVSLDELGRLSLLLADIANSRPPSFAYLQVLQVIRSYINHHPLALKQSIVLKKVLQNAIVNAGIWCLNQNLVYEFLTALKEVPEDNKFSKLLGGLTKMCVALASSHYLLNSANKRLSLQCMEQSLVSLDFLPRLPVVRIAIQAMCCAKEDWDSSVSLLSLLAHSNTDVQAEAYASCYRTVCATIGVGQAKDPLSYTPENVVFLCNDKVIHEIICFGLAHENSKIKFHAEGILLHLMKCRLLVPAHIWSRISSCIAFLIPFLVSKISSSKPLHQTLLSYLKPETSMRDIFQCARGNACLLFSKDESVRLAGSTCLLSIVKEHPESYKKWPEFSSVETDSSAMSHLCVVDEPFVFNSNINKIFYNESSLRQIIGLLSPDCSDPNVKDSAFRQLSAMLMESRLLTVFIEAGGVEICVSSLDSALLRNNTEVLSKSVKPIVSILCMVASTHNSLCLHLAQDQALLINLIRAMFLYSSIDSDFQQHHSTLLALLLFSDLLRHKSPDESLVLPHQIIEGLVLPFSAGSYARVSSHMPTDHWQRLRTLADDTDNLSLLLRCHLTLESTQTLHNLEEVEKAGLLTKKEIQHLIELDARSSLLRAFAYVQNASSHSQVMNALPTLTSYLPCTKLKDLPWLENFARFLIHPPATHEDETLLLAIIDLLVKHNVTSWIPWSDIIPKLEPYQPSVLKTFLPLLSSSCEHLQEIHVAKSIIALNRCLAMHDENSDIGVLRSILHCLSELTGAHQVQISSRLMADLMSPLVNVVLEFNVEGSFVHLNLIEQALTCLSNIQANNSRNFSHHFCVQSETCDIFIVLLKIISSDKTICKGHSLSILGGLASCNGMKDNTRELMDCIHKSLSLSLDKREANLIRCESITFLSSVLENSLGEPGTARFFKILQDTQWFQQICNLQHGLYLEKKFSLAYLNGSSDCCDDILQDMITPEFAAALHTFMYNLAVANPFAMMAIIKQHELFYQATSFLLMCLERKEKLSLAVSSLINQTANFITYCLITDDTEHFAKQVHKFPYLTPQILNLINVQDFELVACATLWLMLSLEQAGHGGLFAAAFYQGQFWTPLIKALNNAESEEPAILLIRALTLQENAQNAPKILKADPKCAELVQLLSLRLHKEDTHQNAMAALAGLFTICPESRKTAVKKGLMENIIVAIGHCRMGLLTIRDLKHACSDKQNHELIVEIINSFELMVGFLINDEQIKKVASETALADEINKLWSICLINSRFLKTTLKLLAIYTKGCEQACTSLLLRQQMVGGVKIRKCATNTSVLHQLSQLATTDLTNNNSDTVCLILKILRHMCLSPECRAALVKTSLLQDIMVHNGGLSRLTSSTKRAALTLIEELTRHAEGQLAVARISEAIEYLSIFATDSKVDGEINLLCAEILRNLCFCQANRTLLLSSGNMQSCFLSVLREGAPNIVRQVAAAVWSLSANQHRSKQALKIAGFQEALSKARLRCAHSKETISVLESALKTLRAI